MQRVDAEAERRVLEAAADLRGTADLLPNCAVNRKLVLDHLAADVRRRCRSTSDSESVGDVAERAALELDEIELVGARADLGGRVEPRDSARRR